MVNKIESKIIVYGIANCNTIKKTIIWFKINDLDFIFFDYKKNVISKSKLKDWCKLVDWKLLMNKNGTTFKKLPIDEQLKINTISKAIQFMYENNSSIKRPIIEFNDEIIVGFEEKKFNQLFL